MHFLPKMRDRRPASDEEIEWFCGLMNQMELVPGQYLKEVCGVYFSIYIPSNNEGNYYVCVHDKLNAGGTEYAWGILDVHMDGFYVFVKLGQEERMGRDMILYKMGS